MIYAYSLTSLESNKIEYIGLTKNIKSRLNQSAKESKELPILLFEHIS